ncbi:MAG: lytic transglycosylase domain-containing protein, partial [Polyangiaceae bacterium]|nr:lytic transglycosylase domain-containing protein [Polyangiaceae bacterium]
MASLSRKNAALVAGLGLASVAVITALAVGGGSPPPAETPPEPQVVDKGPVSLETSDLEGDFELVDPDVIPTAGLEGVITTLSDLPIPLTQRTMRYVSHFGTTEKGKKTFSDRMRKASRFREHLEQRIHDQDFPEDVLWLAAIESGFNPQATSPAGAAGLFQFMPETAERFGLTVGSQIDERRSVTKSTDAALSYLGFLFDTFGTWDLALAAYNCGEGRLDDAIEKGRAALGRSEEDHVAFHELAELRLLPRETMNFVPQIHAFAIVVHNRELLGLEEIETLPFMHFAEVAVPAGTRLAPIARAADISIATLREYNPDLLTDRLPPGRGDYLVNIPAESLDQALAAMPALIARDEEGHGAEPATDVPAAVAPPKVAAATRDASSTKASDKSTSDAKTAEMT